jgi:hypothetical protein
MIGQVSLDFWIENEVNVLFRGRHGVGKTTMVIDALNRKKLNWLYFSTRTMDPWVDFIGVPKEHKDADGSYLEHIRFECKARDLVEAAKSAEEIVTLVDSRRPSRSKQAQAFGL